MKPPVRPLSRHAPATTLLASRRQLDVKCHAGEEARWIAAAGELFSPAEFAARLAAVRHRMAGQGLSALPVTGPANIYYLTGYNAWSFYTPQLLFVPAEGDMVLFNRQMDAAGAWRTAWLAAENIVGYPESYVHRPQLHPFDWVAFALRQRHLVAPAARGCVGLKMDAHFFSPKAYRALVNAIPKWTLVDCFELVSWVRAVKSRPKSS